MMPPFAYLMGRELQQFGFHFVAKLQRHVARVCALGFVSLHLLLFNLNKNANYIHILSLSLLVAPPPNYFHLTFIQTYIYF